MSKRLRRSILAVFVSVAVFAAAILLSPAGRNALAFQVTSLYLGDDVVDSGYTVSTPDEEFKVGVLPHVLNGASEVKLTILDEDTFPELEGWTRVTPLAESYIENADAFPSVHPYLSLEYDTEKVKNGLVRIAYYDKGKAEWIFLPSSLAPDTQNVRTRVPFSVVTIAGFTPDLPPAPEKTTDVAAPGSVARAVIVVDDSSGQVLHEYNAYETLPLASLTKLVTAHVAIESGLNLDGQTTYDLADNASGASVRLLPGDVVSNRDVLHGALVKSGNNTAKLLARSTGVPSAEFAARMTRDARDIGLSTPSFVEPSGLNAENRSSAFDFAMLSRECFRNPDIMQASTARSYSFTTQNSGRGVTLSNTNWWLNENPFYVTGSKTGYLPSSWGGIGFSLVVKARSAAHSNDDVVVLVMGSSGRTQAIRDVDALVYWALENHSWE